MRRRTLLAAGATVASGLLPRKPRAAGPGEGLPDLRQLTVKPGGAPLPEFRFKLPDGTVQRVADYAGKGLVLNLWATWCVPCVAEMPALDALAVAVADGGVVVLPLSSDRGGVPVVERFYRERGIAHLPVLLDPAGSGARILGARGIPTTLLIDKGGLERGRMEGAADWASAEAIKLVRTLMAS